MRESPSCTVTLRRFGAWRAAVAFITAAAVAAVAAWAAQSLPSEPAARSGLVLGTAAALVVASVWLGLSLARVPKGVLSGIGSRWSFVAEGSASPDPEPGDLAVAIDLGSFVLLSLVAGRPGAARRRWLPVQRGGLERDWHAFRCALYSPLPASLAGEAPV